MSISLVLAASPSLEALIPFIWHAVVLAVIWAVVCRFVGDGNVKWLVGLLFAVIIIIDALHLLHLNF